MVLEAVFAQSQGADLTPIIVAVIAAIGGGLVSTLLTLGPTRRSAAAAAEASAAEAQERAVASIDRVREALEQRLSETEAELDTTRRELAYATDRINALSEAAATNRAERERLRIILENERMRLQGRVDELEREILVLRTEVERHRLQLPEGNDPDPP